MTGVFARRRERLLAMNGVTVENIVDSAKALLK